MSMTDIEQGHDASSAVFEKSAPAAWSPWICLQPIFVVASSDSERLRTRKWRRAAAAGLPVRVLQYDMRSSGTQEYATVIGD